MFKKKSQFLKVILIYSVNKTTKKKKAREGMKGGGKLAGF